MRDYDDRWGRSRYARGRDDMENYGRRDYEYRGGYRQDLESGREYGRADWGRRYGQGREHPVDYAQGMRDDMRRYARGDYERGYDRGYGRDERGLLERAGDEIASWFGDEDAERRRRQDEARSHRGRGPRGYIRSDERIHEDVNERLTDDPYVDATDVEVIVSACEVTLNGHVPHRGMKRRAEDIAESVSGVTHVQNNLRVRQSTGMESGTITGSSTTAGASAMADIGGTGGAASATTRAGRRKG
ncbi:MAG TPA: BON domain-containing protein [Azospirillum sp.]|nr:BON domain-containing protein [Azospirillum sp.]